MSSLGRVVRVGAGVGAVVGALVVLAACTGQQSSSAGGQVTGTSTAATSAQATQFVQVTEVTRVTQVPQTSQVATRAPADGCASATKGTLEAVLKANKEMSSSLLIDSKGLQDIKCASPWAIASFSNNLDGGSVLFKYQGGVWVAKDGGTDVCSDVSDATAKQICG